MYPWCPFDQQGDHQYSKKQRRKVSFCSKDNILKCPGHSTAMFSMENAFSFTFATVRQQRPLDLENV
jgi:hypothetical protein